MPIFYMYKFNLCDINLGSSNKGPASKRRRTSSRSQDEDFIITVSVIMKLFTKVIDVVLEQGRCSDESTCLPPMCSGLDYGLCLYVCWVCCWFSLCSKGFSPGSLVFFAPLKTNISKFQFSQDNRTAWKPARADVTSFLNIVIYLFILILFMLELQWLGS